MGVSLHHTVTVYGRGIKKHGGIRTGIVWQLPVVDLGWQILLRLAWTLQSNIRMRLQNGRGGCAEMAVIPEVAVHTNKSISNPPQPKHILRASFKYFEHRYEYVAAIGCFHSLQRTATRNATT